MIDFRYLDSLPDALVEMYADAETRILQDMAERISAMDYYAAAVQFQERMLQEMGRTHDSIIKELSSLSRKTTAEIERLITDAGAEVLRQNKGLEKLGFDLGNIAGTERWAKQISEGLRKTSMLFENLTRTTANTTTRLFVRACDQAYMDVTSGAFSPKEAISNAVRRLSAQGVRTVEYHNGEVTYRTNNVDVAVRRAVLTGVNQTTGELQLAVNAELGLDLVEVSAHSGARPSHAEWQGGIYSLSGKSLKYGDFREETGYGTGAGLCGWNCRHTFFPYVDGSPRVWSEDALSHLNDKTVEYNGEMLTEYEATQKQRYIERNIRRWKREVLACDAADVPNGRAAERLSYWNRRQDDFIEQTGFKRQFDRTSVVGYNKNIGNTAKGATKKPKSVIKKPKSVINKQESVIKKPENVINKPENVIKNAIGADVRIVKKTLARSTPNSITQTVTKKGGITRNYYDEDGKLVKQISNNDHGHKAEQGFGKHGEHAHDTTIKPDGKMARSKARELTARERTENEDIL